MLTQEENELLTRTGPRTPMGEVMRRYWVPAGLSWELPEPDSAPIRVKLLGERLVAFRDTKGRVGLVEEFCAHRRASLFLGRNEEGGLRCVYHGWKYDVDGNCLEQPNELEGSTFKDKVHLKAYPVVEMGGVIWAYLGPKEKRPPEPSFEWTQVPESHLIVSKTWQECNWLQAVEGGIDGVHASIMHRVITPRTDKAGTRGLLLKSTTPKEEVDLTDYGFVYASTRFLDEGQYIRIYHYVAPFHTFFSSDAVYDNAHMFVPIDDENTMVYNQSYIFGDQPLEKEFIERYRGRDTGEITADFKKVRNKDNDWLIDRHVQKTETFTGLEGVNTQDHAIQESMGPIVDRTQEHLGSTDRAVIQVRRLLLRAIRTVQEGGDLPGLNPSNYRIRTLAKVLPNNAAWRDVLRQEIYPTTTGTTAFSQATMSGR